MAEMFGSFLSFVFLEGPRMYFRLFQTLWTPSNPTSIILKFLLTFIYLLPIFISIVLVIIFSSKGKKEKFIGTDMWYGYGFQDANKTSKQDRTESLIRISKGYLPGERPKSGGLLENFENIRDYYRPRNYEIEPDYHRTVQQFGVDPNPIETLETPEFMIPKTYRNDYNYESLVEVRDNRADAIKLKGKESAFNHIEKNKYYRDLLSSKCRAGNRSSYKNCGCNAPAFGEH